MITHFNIPQAARINTAISKKMFSEKAPLSASEKRLLREEVERLTMKGLLQTQTVGLAAYTDDEYAYDQVIIAEVSIKNPVKAPAIATMIQKAFPVPLFIILHSDGNYCINWCVKRVNQSDDSKRVMGEQQMTRFFALENSDEIQEQWLSSLSIPDIECANLKELYDRLSTKLKMLKVSEEAGTFIELKEKGPEYYHKILEQLNSNRTEQQTTKRELKEETQFNRTLRLNSKLRELQDKEKELKVQLRETKQSTI